MAWATEDASRSLESEAEAFKRAEGAAKMSAENMDMFISKDGSYRFADMMRSFHDEPNDDLWHEMLIYAMCLEWKCALGRLMSLQQQLLQTWLFAVSGYCDPHRPISITTWSAKVSAV